MPNLTEKLVLERIPPGDNWKYVDNEENTFDTLTKALSFVYKTTKLKEFHVSAKQGKVWVMMEEAVDTTEIDSLYGD